MPAPTASSEQLTAVIGFTLPPSPTSDDPNHESFLTYIAGRSKPSEKIRVPVHNLRDELDNDTLHPQNENQKEATSKALEELKERGFAIMKHESEWTHLIPTEEGTRKYLEESQMLLKEILGCTRTIAWNSTCRKNSPEVAEKMVPRQQGPEEGFIPSSRLQPVAGTAHVDQSAEWAFELCGRAAGTPAEQFKRVQIVNLWRPLHGPVTNAPLAMADFRTLATEDIGVHASQFGHGLDIHHNPKQTWSYIRHQMPDEVVWLKCYDSDQGKNGEALYCGHVAVQVDNDEDGIDPELVRPRESIEVRLVAVWE